jgi:hypothetical protein
MYIFGITGPIGHGKTTFAKALMQLSQPSELIETSAIIADVANEWFATFPAGLLIDPLDYQVMDRWIDDLARVVSHQIRPVRPTQLYFNHDQVLAESQYYYKLFMHLNLIRQGVIAIDDPISAATKERHRTILQWLGGYLVHRVDQGIWFDEIERRLKAAQAQGVRMCVVGGVRYPYDAEVIRRNGGLIIYLNRAGLPERELADITEEHRREIKPDTIVISEDGPDSLKELAKIMYNDLLLHDLLGEYHSGDYAIVA